MHRCIDMKTKFWKIAVYSTDRVEGGQEEGGWYFTAGERIKEGKLLFKDAHKARKAINLFNKLYGKRITSNNFGLEADFYFRGTPVYFPKYPPSYS